jgi:hypothetical protein
MVDLKKALRIQQVCQVCKHYEPYIARADSLKGCRYCVQENTPEMIAKLAAHEIYESDFNLHFICFVWASEELKQKYLKESAA